MEKKYYPKTFLQSVAFLIISAIIPAPILLLKINEILSNDEYLVINFIGFILSAISIFFYMNRKNQRSLLIKYKINFRKSILFFVALIIVFQLSIYLPVTYYVHYQMTSGDEFFVYTKYTLLLICLAAIFEEIIFRGIILKGYLLKYRKDLAIFICSIFFGVLHLSLSNPMQFLGATLLGFITGYIYYFSKNISLTIILHLVYNLNGYFMGFIHKSYGETDINSVTSIFGVYSLMVIIVAAIIMAFLIFIIIKKRTHIIRDLSM